MVKKVKLVKKERLVREKARILKKEGWKEMKVISLVSGGFFWFFLCRSEGCKNLGADPLGT